MSSRLSFFYSSLLIMVSVCLPGWVVLAEEPLPIAQTIEVQGENQATGAVIRFTETDATYHVAKQLGWDLLFLNPRA